MKLNLHKTVLKIQGNITLVHSQILSNFHQRFLTWEWCEYYRTTTLDNIVLNSLYTYLLQEFSIKWTANLFRGFASSKKRIMSWSTSMFWNRVYRVSEGKYLYQEMWIRSRRLMTWPAHSHDLNTTISSSHFMKSLVYHYGKPETTAAAGRMEGWSQKK